MNRSYTLIAIVAAAVIAVGAAAWYLLGNNQGDTAAITASAPAGALVTADDRTLGNPKAPVTVIEYAAPMCPHCARMNEEGFPTLKSEYIDTGKVYYIFRVYPIGNADIPAEGIARCLPKEQYFQFIDLLFRRQESWDPEYGVQDVQGGLAALGRIAGLTPEQIQTCMADQANQARVMKVAEEATTRFGVTGTPTFVIDGKPLQGGAPWTDVKAALDAALAAKK